MALTPTPKAPSSDDQSVFTRWTKGRFDKELKPCKTREELADQLAAKRNGATPGGILTLLNAHPEYTERNGAGMISRVPRCRLRRKNARQEVAVA